MLKHGKPPPFHLKPSPSFLYPKEMKGLAAPSLLRGCLAREKGKRENEIKTEASTVSFPKYRTPFFPKSCLGSTYTQSQYNLPNYTNQTLLHEDKLGRNQKAKSRRLQESLQGLRNLAGVANAKLARLLLHLCCITASAFFWLGCSELQLDSSCLDLNPCPQDIQSLKTTKLGTKFD